MGPECVQEPIERLSVLMSPDEGAECMRIRNEQQWGTTASDYICETWGMV